MVIPMQISEENENVYAELELLNALIIGFMVGIYEVIGKGGTQAIINMAGQRAGNEMLRFARERDIPMETFEDLKTFLKSQGLVGEMDFYQSDTTSYVRISECKTCPKKVGHYDFDGTACPWGGILSGALSEITGEQHTTSPKLIPGEYCVLEIHKSRVVDSSE